MLFITPPALPTPVRWNIFGVRTGYPNGGIPGWTALSGSLIELQQIAVNPAAGAGQYCELDAHWPTSLHLGPSDHGIQQTVDLARGRYLLFFDYRGRATNARSFTVKASSGPGMIFGLPNPSPKLLASTTTASTNTWQRASVSFAVAGGDPAQAQLPITLLFDIPDAADSFGAYIDNVILLPMEVNCPELYMFAGHTGDKVELCKASGTCEWKLKSASPAIGTFDHPTDLACSFTATTKGKNTIQLVMGGNVIWEKPTEVIEIVTRAGWGAVAPKAHTYTMPDFQHVTLHHTSNANTGAAEMQRIQQKHMSLFPYVMSFGPFKGLNFDDIGYHFIMDKAGVVYEGRQLEVAPGAPGGPYTKGEHVATNNTVAGIGFCTMGDYEATEGNEAWPAARQKDLEKVVSALCRRYKLPASKLSYHKVMALAASPSLCPGSNYIPSIPDIIKHVTENLQ